MNYDIPIEVVEAAGDWLDRLAPDSPAADRQAFAEWLQRSPTHVEEFLRLTILREELKGAMLPDWVEAVLGDTDTNVVEIQPVTTAPAPTRPHAIAGGRWLAAAAMVSAVCVAGLLGWAISPRAPTDPAVIMTEVGEQRFVLLSDGSSIEINTDSRAEISMTATAREIVLLRGELLVDVVKDPSRPFRVKSGDVIVEAIGTRFAVYRRTADTLVSVVEGRVSVKQTQKANQSAPAEPFGEPMELAAGQQVALAIDQVFAPSPANLEKVTAWTEQRLVFDNEEVGTVVSEFNRYNRSRLLIGDPDLAKRHITGSFDVGDPKHLVALLNAIEPIRIQVTEDGHSMLYRDP